MGNVSFGNDESGRPADAMLLETPSRVALFPTPHRESLHPGVAVVRCNNEWPREVPDEQAAEILFSGSFS